MANQAIHQRPLASNRLAGDVIMIDRTGGTFKVDETYLMPKLYAARVLIESADVLTMGTTPILVVQPPPAGHVLIPLRGLIEFSGGTVNYAVNTDCALGSTSTLTDSAYTLTGKITCLDSMSAFDMQVSNMLTPECTAGVSPTLKDEGLSLKVIGGDPTTGDSDLTVTVWYFQIPV